MSIFRLATLKFAHLLPANLSEQLGRIGVVALQLAAVERPIGQGRLSSEPFSTARKLTRSRRPSVKPGPVSQRLQQLQQHLPALGQSGAHVRPLAELEPPTGSDKSLTAASQIVPKKTRLKPLSVKNHLAQHLRNWRPKKQK